MAFDGVYEGRQIEDANGDPVSGAKIYFYKSGTLTAQAAYTDKELTTPAANPVVADSSGYYDAYLSPLLAYDIVIRSADDATTFASYSRAGGSGGSGSSNDVLIRVDTYSELQALSGDDAEDAVEVMGRSSAGDGAGGMFRWVSGDQSALVTADPGQGEVVPPTSDATGASGVWKRYNHESLRLDQYSTAEQAFQATKDLVLRVPDGTTSIQKANGDTVQIPAGSIVQGDQLDALLQFTDSGTGTIEYLSPQGQVTLRDFSIEHVVSGSGVTAQTIKPRSDFRMSGVSVDGNVTESGGSVAHIQQTFDFSENIDVSRFWSIGNYFHDGGRVFLKANATTATHRHIKFIGDVIENAFVEPIALNSPGGTLQDGLFLGVSVRNTQHNLVSLEGAGLGSSSGEDIRWIGNNHYGTGDELIHGEEGLTRFACLGNTGYFTDANSGFFITDNNQSGSSKTPSFGVVAGNVFVRSSRGTGPIGIQMVDDASGFAPLHDSIILGNVSSGWDQAARTGESHDRNIMAYNLFDDANQGLRMKRPTLMTRHNLFKDNDQAIQLDSGGAVGPQMFIQTASWDGTANYISQPVEPGSHKGTILGWTIDVEDFTLVNGARNYMIMPLGEYLSGDMWVVMYQGTSIHRLAHYRPTWDGTTLTAGLVGAIKGTGGVSLVDIRDDGSSNLSVRFNNTTGGDLSSARLQIEFRGAHQFA